MINLNDFVECDVVVVEYVLGMFGFEEYVVIDVVLVCDIVLLRVVYVW